jgi:glycosyltransferase involved in cell wall biosynthesis
VGTYVAELLRALANHPQDVELAVYEDPRNTVQTLHGLNVEKIPVRSGKYSLSEQVELARRTRLDRLDLFHSPFYVVPLMAGCPVVVTIHDLIPFLFPIYSPLKQTVVKSGYQVAARLAAHIIADSTNTARDVEQRLGASPEKVTAVPIAADSFSYCAQGTDVKEPEAEWAILRERFGVTGPYVMAASARNWRHKNLGGALAALELAVKTSGLKFQTIIYGPPDGLDAAGGAQRWQSVGLRYAGFTAVADLSMLFRHARAFIMPSLYEGFGLPVLEAMSCGSPVITSSGGSLPEVAGSGAQVFAPHDVAGMASAITRLLTSDADFEQWRAAALKQAAQFSWERTAQETIKVYRRVCAAKLSAGNR